MSLACSPWFGQQKMYRYGESQARAGGAYQPMVGVHFGCAEGGVGVGTGKRPPGGAAAGQRFARVIGGVNTYHLSATLWRCFRNLRAFGAPWRLAAAAAARCPPHCVLPEESPSKNRPLKSRLF